MDWNDYKTRFSDEAQRQGRQLSFIEAALNYAENLANRGLPIIYDFAHLGALLGFDESALRNAIQHPANLYATFFIPKRATGYRRIDAPVPSLRSIQIWILVNILNRCEPHAAATAFFKGRSIKVNAEPHRAKPAVLSLDIKDFFASISKASVMEIFASLGYNLEVVDALAKLTTFRDGLPQGAATSPALSNLAMRNIDETLSNYAASRSIKYSRYADDMTFSGRFRAGDIVFKVRRTLEPLGLTLNESKTRLMLQHQRQEVTGVVVNDHLQAPRQLRRTLRQEIYYIKKLGLTTHESNRPSEYQNRLDHLYGLAQFILFVNPEDRDARIAVEFLRELRIK